MKNIIIFSILLILFSCCKKNNNSTSSNGDYFNCKVNDNYWEADKSSGIGDYPLKAELLYNSSVLSISAINQNNETIDIGLLETQGITEEAFVLTINAPNSYTSNAQFDNNTATNQFETDSIYTGIAQITNISFSEKVAEGTFSFTAYNKILLTTVNITDGHFKIHYSKN